MSMFRRKEDDDIGIDTETTTLASEAAPANMAPMPAMPSAAAAPAASAAMPSAAAAPRPVAAAPATAPGFRPTPTAVPSAASMGAAPARPTAPSSSASGGKAGKRILTVGNDILLKGEIATCDRLVIEGSVDARLNDVHTVEIAETGSFKGTAEIEDAEISGLFEGELIVRNRLTIYATGKVRGKIAYGEIEIERGGQMTGEITIGAPAKSA
ncbi:MAG: polymer-forming cytoskeletal protein [Rickettsiales bacterium]|nr:polymer-forming cytoskeletal protein [Rickettsiales bacterium]